MSYSIEELTAVAEGQFQRTVLDETQKGYMSKMAVMSNMMDKFQEPLRGESLHIVDNNAQHHIGEAARILKLKLPLTVRVAQSIFAAISINEDLPKRKRRRADDDDEVAVNNDDEDGTVVDVRNMLNPAANKVTVSAQTYQNYKSALRWWHEHNDPIFKDKVGFPWPESVNMAVKQQIASYKRDVGEKKRKGIMRKKEGKSAYNLIGYITINQYLNRIRPRGHQGTWMEGIFAQLFHKLDMNTIGRANNVDDILLTNIRWENDAFMVCFGNTKSDKEGTITSEYKRIYENIFEYEICANYAMAIYMWCKHWPPGCRYLFEGGDQYKRYYNNLKQAVNSIPDHIDIGCAKEDIGTHSTRKFAESTAVCTVDGPSRIQVQLRAGQSVGKTQDCYITAELDGDSFVGRTVSKLKQNADQFDILPCHFGTETLHQLSQYGWNNIFEDYDNIPEETQSGIPYWFATHVYHYHKGNAERMLPWDHPLFSTRIFRNRALINSLKEKVIVCHI